MGPVPASPTSATSQSTLILKKRLPERGRAAAARTFVGEALAGWAAQSGGAASGITDRLIDDAVLLAGELATSEVARAGADVEIACLLEASRQAAATGSTAAPRAGEKPGAVTVEVTDRLPGSEAGGRQDAWHDEPGGGLQLVRTLAESWGVTYRHGRKVAWLRLTGQGPGHEPASGSRVHPDGSFGSGEGHPEPVLSSRSGPTGGAPEGLGLSFLAEASELLAGQLDEDMVAALAGQLIVPRFADWCGVWLGVDGSRLRLSRVWHADERRIGALQAALAKAPPAASPGTRATSWPWPESPDGAGEGGTALAIPLVAGSRLQGVLVFGRAGVPWITDDVVRLMETVARQVAQAIATAHQYTRQTAISRALQRRQLPASLAEVPGIDTAVVYEPSGEGQTVGGDFYDLFPRGDGSWSFLLGDVCGTDPEAMSVTGLARHLVRLLAREGNDAALLLRRLNAELTDSGLLITPGSEFSDPRFLSLLYGEMKPDPQMGGAHCTVASAGHPLPLRLLPDGSVAPVADSQILLGVDANADFHNNSFDLSPGETLLCVTDGVTERRNGNRELDDDDGLAAVLSGCTGLGASAVAERVRSAVRDFAPEPARDDLTVLVLEAPRQGADPAPVRGRPS